ncbi:hypothetical protein Tco_1014139, partial [Tanacetum coccineum]
MIMTIEPEIQRNLENLHAHEIIEELKTLFAQQAEQELLQTTQDFHSCKQEEGYLILIVLRKEYDGFVQNYNMHNMGKTINELHAMLNVHEQTLPKNNAPALYAIKAGKGLRESRKLKPGALSLYMGNGQRKVVEAIGIFHLCLPSGLEIVLNNCHYAPSITIGVIYVSRLYEDGFVNCFVNNAIQVSRNNMVYFSVIPRDGVFEIDLSNSYANDSSIKKRIEKLQHNGLLNSTDLMAFEKCVSCMSRKMARKPYTHQVERAKDLLGLIHTDNSGQRSGM